MWAYFMFLTNSARSHTAGKSVQSHITMATLVSTEPPMQTCSGKVLSQTIHRDSKVEPHHQMLLLEQGEGKAYPSAKRDINIASEQRLSSWVQQKFTEIERKRRKLAEFVTSYLYLLQKKSQRISSFFEPKSPNCSARRKNLLLWQAGDEGKHIFRTYSLVPRSPVSDRDFSKMFRRICFVTCDEAGGKSGKTSYHWNLCLGLVSWKPSQDHLMF